MTQLQKDVYRKTLLSMTTEKLHEILRQRISREKQGLIIAELYNRQSNHIN